MKTNHEIAGSASVEMRNSDHRKNSVTESETTKVGRNYGLFLDKNCISCSGNQPIVLQHLKMACLNYTNSLVQYNSKQYSMDEITDIKDKLLSQCESALDEAFTVMKPSESFDVKASIDIKNSNKSKPDPVTATATETTTINHSRFRSFEKHQNSTLSDYLS